MQKVHFLHCVLVLIRVVELAFIDVIKMKISRQLYWGWLRFIVSITLQSLHSWHVSLVAQTGLQFDLSTPQGRLTVNDIVKRHRQSVQKSEETLCEPEEFTQPVFQP